MKFDVRYYLIAILFILFDLEIAFLFPWATVFQEFIAAGEIAWFVFGSVVVSWRFWSLAISSSGKTAHSTGNVHEH